MATVVRAKATGNITATGTVASILWRNEANGRAAVQIVATALTGTVQVQYTVDGTNYVAAQSTNVSTGSAATDITAAGIYTCDVVGAQIVRVQCTAFTSATAAVATIVGMIG